MVHNIIEAEGSAGDSFGKSSAPSSFGMEEIMQYTDIGIDLGTASILVLSLIHI